MKANEPTWCLYLSGDGYGPYILSINDHYVYICRAAGDWMLKNWGHRVPLLTAWRECNVPAWMTYVIGQLAPDIRPEIWSITYQMDLAYTDNKPREDLADALRVIFPEEYIRLLLGVS